MIAGEEFRKLMGRWTTGVTIVTARSGEKIHGMTVSAFTEVSLDPPLVLVCCDKSSNTQQLMAEGGVFAVNILARDQEEVSNRFASKKDEFRRFEGLDYRSGETGSPLLAGALATLDCRVVAAHEAGDHVIYVGEVVGVEVSERAPLLHYRRAYRSLSDSDDG